jgi:hypothetical protein
MSLVWRLSSMFLQRCLSFLELKSVWRGLLLVVSLSSLMECHLVSVVVVYILTIRDIVSFSLTYCTFFQPQPLDGRYDWYSRARSTFMDVARVTDPLQRSVIEYVLRNCASITHAMTFGRPSFDTYGDQSWWRTMNIVLHQATILYHPACCVLMGWMTQEARDNWVNTIGRIVADLLGVSPRHFTSEQANRII